jgi:hypothetical protein
MPFPRALHPTTVGLSLAGIRVPGLKMPLFGGDGSWNNVDVHILVGLHALAFSVLHGSMYYVQ